MGAPRIERNWPVGGKHIKHMCPAGRSIFIGSWPTLAPIGFVELCKV